ncbi:hypothetical protein [Streptomyces sp. NPDC020983]|uniref:hypothetical protein n=1 Tax=Streptomyces sp. NPDC020983 TaxID=3365106 RepID=UPI0037A84C89
MIITLSMDGGPVDIHIHRTAAGPVRITAHRGDTQLGTAIDAPRPINAYLREQLGDHGADRTHHIGTLLLTPDHVAQITAAVASASAETAPLDTQRTLLVNTLSDARNEISAARSTASDGEGLASYLSSGQAVEDAAREHAAAEALAEFDAAHPGVREEQAERRRAADRADVQRALDL